MKAVFIEGHGNASDLSYGAAPDPKPGPGEVLLQARAAALRCLLGASGASSLAPSRSGRPASSWRVAITSRRLCCRLARPQDQTVKSDPLPLPDRGAAGGRSRRGTG